MANICSHHDVIKCGNIFRFTGEFPAQRPVMRSFDFFFDLSLNNGWVNIGEAGDLRRHRAHYDVIVMQNMQTGSHLNIKTIFPDMWIPLIKIRW